MRIERDIIYSFKRWKGSSDRKPILNAEPAI